MPNLVLKVGDKAPDFSLLDQDGARVGLSTFLGKQPVVLLFYAGDLLPGCAMQLCSIRDEWAAFQKANIAVFGVNPAPAESHKQFLKRCNIPFPLLIDPDKQTCENYQATYSLFHLRLVRRTVVGIDRDGVVRFFKHGLPRAAEVLKIMQRYA